MVIGAALAVFVAYPLLPTQHKMWVHNIQEQVGNLAPWTPNR